MKRIISIILCCLLLLSFAGCKEKNNDTHSPTTSNSDDKVTITVAVDIYESGTIKQLKKCAQILYPELQIEFIEFDYNNNDQTKRNSQLTAMKSDIIAGKGPDAFILSTIVPWEQYDDNEQVIVEDKLFRDPQKTMRNNILLPLDDYIANSVVFSMDDHVECIMEAGKYDGKQYILPLTYTYEVYLYNKTDIGSDAITTWDDVVSHENKAFVNDMKACSWDWMANRFVNIADYDNNSLLITKDDILNELALIDAMGDDVSGRIDRVDSFTSLCGTFLNDWNTFGDQVTAVPVLNKDNGITAFVNHYAAVNANSENPEWAYKFIELFFSPEVQSNEGFTYEDGGETKRTGGSCRPDGMMYLFYEGIATGKIMCEEYPMLEEMNSKINCVRFYSPNDKLFYDIALEYRTSGDTSIVDKYYTSMQMEMAE